MQINEAIKHYRTKCEMTQLELDVAAGLRGLTTKRYERDLGTDYNPNYSKLMAIIKAFRERLGDDFDLEVFFGFKELEK